MECQITAEAYIEAVKAELATICTLNIHISYIDIQILITFSFADGVSGHRYIGIHSVP